MVEFDYGDWEGHDAPTRSTDKLHDEYELYDANPAIYRPAVARTAIRPPNGRLRADRLAARVVGRRQATEPCCLLVGHSSINRVLLALITGVPMADYRRRFLQDWANLTVLRWHDRDERSAARCWPTTWPTSAASRRNMGVTMSSTLIDTGSRCRPVARGSRGRCPGRRRRCALADDARARMQASREVIEELVAD